MIDRTCLHWIDSQRGRMVDRVTRWCNINSGTMNLAGVAVLGDVLKTEFSVFGSSIDEVTLPPAESIDSRGQPVLMPLGTALLFAKQRPDASLRVLLNIHRDTVYPADHPFQSSSLPDSHTLRGPGVADAKGGIAVMLTALEALERSPYAGGVAWEVLINPDEEIGSPGSAGLLARCAKRNHLGLLFEPALPDGALVCSRRGTGNYTIVIHGRSAHAGRDFDRGRSAIVAMSRLVMQLHAMNKSIPGITVNVGRVEGGGALNVVPDLAICRINVRTTVPADEQRLVLELERLVSGISADDGISADLHGGITSPPKVPDERTRRLMNAVEECGNELNIPIQWRDSGGASDGNKLAAAGLANIDNLGPCGGDIHSPSEYLLLDSLTERAKLSALLLMKLAAGEIEGFADIV